MPIYEYNCKNCQIEFEYFHVSPNEEAECPKCACKGEEFLTRLISKNTGHILKGGGWYRDGYGGNRNKKKGK